MQKFRVNQTALFQTTVFAETEEEAEKDFERIMDAVISNDNVAASWSEVRVTSLEQECKDRIESSREEEYRDERKNYNN